MVYKSNNNVELYIDNVLVDTSEDLSIRMNNVLFDPEEMSSKSADYSFSFSLPATPKNDKVFQYARVLSVPNKFIRTLPARLYADGQLLFDGTITLNSYKDGNYNVNLVSIRVIDFSNIFGNTTLNELDWYIPFYGAPTVNAMNSEGNKDVMFPLVSYGAFQKKAKLQDEVGSEYTSKFDLDQWNRWYIESFYPSMNMLTLMKKFFESKGYNVQGDVFNDETLRSVYTSVNLADGQDPTYNLANPIFGKVSIDINASTSGLGYEQELAFPTFKVEQRYASRYTSTAESYNWQSVMLYDLLASGTTVMKQSPCYMYQPNEHIIVIPASGFYKIGMEVSSITQSTGTMQVDCDVLKSETEPTLTSTTITISKGLKESTPIEIQLVRNYDDDIELIKGRRNVMYTNGNPNTQIWSGTGNKQEWLTCFPHCDPYNAKIPSEKNGLSFRNTNTSNGRGVNRNSTTSRTTERIVDEEAEREGRRGSGGGSSRDGANTTTTSSRSYYKSCKGYMYAYDGSEIMAYDPAANPNFVCGISTLSNGVPSVIKNGRSWSATIGEENSSFYKQNGYWRLTSYNSGDTMEHTTAYENEYIDAPTSYVNVSDHSANGRVECMVWLEKNDVLQLFAVQRAYSNTGGTEPYYSTNISMGLTIEAASMYDYAALKLRNYGYGSSSDFDQNLRLGNFLSSAMTMSDWVQDIVKAFNFSVIQEGNNIFVNKKQQFSLGTTSIIDIDNKVNSNDAEISGIDYPSEMAVRYSINKDEYGFECSVPDEHINDADWDAYGDSGFTTIKLSDKVGATELYNDLKLSYCWYVPFNWYNVTSADTLVNSATTTLWLPTIAKSEWMIDGYDYTDSMKYDGFGLSQRLWFKPLSSETFVWLDVYPAQKVNVYIPTNERNGINLSYKTSEESLLNYFSITPYNSSNFVTLDVYLTSEEYKLVKSGARVRFDKDIYLPTEVSGYDPSGKNPASLTMIKRV